MEQFKALQMTLFSKSISPIISWVSLSLGLALFIYAFIADKEHFQIFAGISALIAIVGISSVFIYNSQQISKKTNKVMSFYNKWYETFDTPKLKDNPKRDRKIIRSNMRIDWSKKNKIEVISFNGYSDNITPSIIEEIINDLNALNDNEKDYNFVVKLEEASSEGSLYAKRVDNNSSEGKIFRARLKTSALIFEKVGKIYGNIPQIQFSESFETGSKELFNSIMIQGNHELISKKSQNEIVNDLNRIFEVPEDKTWGVQVVSSSVFSFKIMNKKDQRSENADYFDKFLVKAFEASCRKVQLNVNIDDINITQMLNNIPEEFLIKLTDDSINLENSQVISIVKNMIIILKNKYDGNWKASNELFDNHSIIFRKFD